MAGFIAGFGTKLSELIEEDRKYYRDRAAKRQDYLQTYGTRAVADREGKANAALGVANYLITNGISKDDVRYVVDTSGVQGLAQLKATIDSRTDLTADEKSSLVKKAKDYVADNPDEDLNTVVKRAYGLYKSSDNPVKRERSLFGSILGLDSRMMEDEVMDDLYINGYTGRDVYRIMGSAGPTSGSPLDLDLPLKPLSSQTQRNIALMITDKFESSVDAQITLKQSEYQRADADRQLEIVKEIEKLEVFKGQGISGIGPYATKYDTSIFDFAKALYDDDPRNIVGNTNLLTFESTFTDYFADKEDEAKVSELRSTDRAPAADTVTPPEEEDTPPSEPPKKTTHKVTSEAEALELLESGKVKIGDDIDINGTIRPVKNIPESAPKTTDLGDMTGAPGFRERDGIPEAEPVDETIRSSRREKRTATEIDTNILDTISDFFTRSSTSSRGRNVNRGSAVGVDTETPVEVEELMINIPKRSEWTSTSQPAGEDGRLLRTDDVLFDTLVYDRQNESLPDSFYLDEGYTQDQLDRMKKEVDAAFERERQTMEDRIRDDARQFLQDEKNFPQPLPTIIIEKLENDIVEEAKVDVEVMRIVQQLVKKGETPSRKDVEDLKTALELNQEIDTSTDELYRGPISGKTLVEKLDDIWNFYTSDGETEYNPRAIGTVGSRDLGLRDTNDDVRERQNQPADLQMSAARGPSPEADQQDFDSPRNMAVENFTTRGINATPRGLMTPRKEFAPKLGQAQFGDLIDRVHGSSKAAEAFNKKVSSGTVKPADVTRLIKATRKLPKTTSRGTLLDSLFDLRDALNKR